MKNYKLDLAFLDMLFNMTLAFSFLFLMSFLLIRPQTPPAESSVKMKAEFLISLSWPEGSLDDQDLWVQLPNGKVVSYSSRDLGYATLDRDDRGTIGNFFVDESNKITQLKERNEVITIRTIMPGRYVVNVYSYNETSDWRDFKNPKSMPYEVTVRLTKINPMVKEIVKREKLMRHRGDQATAFAFTVAEDGSVTSVETDIDEPFIDRYRVMP